MATRPPLTPKSAQITTATVEIKAMTVNGKQVTLAVFRQLYDEPLYDPLTWEPAGTPWCRVNYHPDKCDRDPIAHEHVVLQKGSELRRSRVNQPDGTLDSAPRFDEQHDDEAAICVAAGSIGNAWITSVKGDHSPYASARSSIKLRDPEVHIAADLNGRPAKAKLYPSDRHTASLAKGYGDQPHPSLHSEHTRIHPDNEGCARIAKILGHRLIQQTDWLDNAQRRWEEIQNLAQVFIAL